MSAPELPPESPIEAAHAVAERACSHYRAYAASLDELASALAEASLDGLERDIRNARERARPMEQYLAMLPGRIVRFAP